MGDTDQLPSAGRPARRSVSMLSLATLVGQGVTFAAIPFITRLFDPEIYGHYQTLYAAITVLGVVAALRLERAIPLAPDDLSARAVVVSAYLLAATTMGVLTLVCLISPRFMAGLLGNPEVAHVVWVVPVCALLTSGYVIATQWAVRVQRHGPIALRNAAQPAITAISQVALGLFSATMAALVIGLFLGRLVGALSAVKEIVQRGSRPSGGLVLTQVSRYRGFIFMSAPSALLNAAALQLPVLVIGAVFGVEYAGLYGVAALLTVAPVTLLAGAMSQVTMGAVTQRIRSGRDGVHRLIHRGVVFTAVVSVGVATIMALASRLITEVLGGNWAGAANFIVALSLVLAARLPATAVSPALSAMERHRATLSIDATRVLVVIGTLFWASRAGWSAEHALFLMAAGVTLTYAVVIALTLRGAAQHDELVRDRQTPV